MDVAQAVRDYLAELLAPSRVPGMKVLIYDRFTVGVVSAVESMRGLLQREVFITEHLDQFGEPNTIRQRAQSMQHLKAVLWIRPTEENIGHLSRELHDPKYGEYHVVFSNVVPEEYVEQLAVADEYEVVRSMAVYYGGDFVALSPELFTLNAPPAQPLSAVVSPRSEEAGNTRLMQGLAAVLLALKQKPAIRYAKVGWRALPAGPRSADSRWVCVSQVSAQACAVAGAVDDFISANPRLFAFERPQVRPVRQVLARGLRDSHGCRQDDTPPMLLILDRKDDPVTPLLNQWTYQAMIHELLGISNNKVEAGESKQVVNLHTESDAFYKANIFADYGRVGENLQRVVADFKAHNASNKEFTALKQEKGAQHAAGASAFGTVKDFIRRYPKFKQLQGDIEKVRPAPGARRPAPPEPSRAGAGSTSRSSRSSTPSSTPAGSGSSASSSRSWSASRLTSRATSAGCGSGCRRRAGRTRSWTR
jgi:vacuolar protein sorting-associated protein 45